MSLSIEQLQKLHDAFVDFAIVTVAVAPHKLDAAMGVVPLLLAEINRRKHGPFTLAEAVASGRPFRRKGAGHWTRKAPAPGDGEPFFEAMTAFDKWEPCPSVSDQHGFTVAEEWLSIDDITVCDYELKGEDKQ